MSDAPMPGPTPGTQARMRREKRDDMIAQLARASAIAMQLGRTLEALKVSIVKGDDELADAQRVGAYILEKRLLDSMARPGYVDAVHPTSPAAALAPQPPADPIAGDPAGAPGHGAEAAPTASAPALGIVVEGVA